MSIGIVHGHLAGVKNGLLGVQRPGDKLFRFIGTHAEACEGIFAGLVVVLYLQFLHDESVLAGIYFAQQHQSAAEFSGRCQSAGVYATNVVGVDFAEVNSRGDGLSLNLVYPYAMGSVEANAHAQQKVELAHCPAAVHRSVEF